MVNYKTKYLEMKLKYINAKQKMVVGLSNAQWQDIQNLLNTWPPRSGSKGDMARAIRPFTDDYNPGDDDATAVTQILYALRNGDTSVADAINDFNNLPNNPLGAAAAKAAAAAAAAAAEAKAAAAKAKAAAAAGPGAAGPAPGAVAPVIPQPGVFLFPDGSRIWISPQTAYHMATNTCAMRLITAPGGINLWGLYAWYPASTIRDNVTYAEVYASLNPPGGVPAQLLVGFFVPHAFY